jgi:arylsulfatase A-like enzyme
MTARVRITAVPALVVLIGGAACAPGGPTGPAGASAASTGITGATEPGPAGTRAAGTTAAALARPNIVFILSDDQDASLENMPRLRALLADQGLTFERFFASSPLCAPARASLLTGLHAHTHGVTANRAPTGGFERFRDSGLEADTVATWLRAAGYRTGLVGKYLNRYPGDARDANLAYVPPGWDLFAAFFAPDRTSGAYFDYYVNLDGDPTFYPRHPRDYITDHIARLALAAIDTLPGANGAPFFLHVTPNAPHSPPVPAERHAGSLAGLRAPRVGAFNEADMSDKPPYYQSLPLLDDRALTRLDDLHQKRQETLQAVDELVEAVVRRLDERGLLANTYVVYSSDNGFMLGQHRFPQGKDTPYDESIRVPLVVRGPGVPRGATAELAANVDLPVTFADLAGVTPPATVEGRSLAAVLRGMGGSGRDEVLIEHSLDDGDADGVPAYVGLRTRDFTYVEYDDGARELYDLRTDPGQEDNLAGRADPALVAPLAARLRALRSCRGAACR